MAKIRNDYFKLLEEQGGYCVKASTLLSEILCNYTALSIPKQREKMHEIENAADELHHQILSRLSAEFLTPIDQEDILHLVQIIDDITDALDEVVLDFYMFNIAVTPIYVPSFSKVVDKCVNALFKAIKELRNFKNPTTLRRLLVEVKSVESQGDEIFVEAIHHLFTNEKNCDILISHKDIYESLEECCNQCEHAADVIQQIIIKNT